jgi:hypothetical protein
MRGEFIAVWEETWTHIWQELIAHESAPADIFPELYRDLSKALDIPPTAQELVDIVQEPTKSRDRFMAVSSADLVGEKRVVTFLEGVHPLLTELGGESLSGYYFDLLEGFVRKFSLRYDMQMPCALCPTLPGVFASLVRDLHIIVAKDADLKKRMDEFEESVRDLRYGCTEGRIKTCISKNVMLLEGMGSLCSGVTKKTLGDMCDQLGSWPHATVREALKKLYGFTSDHSGVRHGSIKKDARPRDVDMRDMIAMSILLIGFTPYFAQINAEGIYHGK